MRFCFRFSPSLINYIDTNIEGNQTLLELYILGNKTAMVAAINITALELEISGNRTEIENEMYANNSLIYNYVDTNILGNVSSLESYIDVNIMNNIQQI